LLASGWSTKDFSPARDWEKYGFMEGDEIPDGWTVSVRYRDAEGVFRTRHYLLALTEKDAARQAVQAKSCHLRES
jgi:hypothetical protein